MINFTWSELVAGQEIEMSKRVTITWEDKAHEHVGGYNFAYGNVDQTGKYFRFNGQAVMKNDILGITPGEVLKIENFPQLKFEER